MRGIKRSVEIDGVPITQTKGRSFPIVSIKLQKKTKVPNSTNYWKCSHQSSVVKTFYRLGVIGSFHGNVERLMDDTVQAEFSADAPNFNCTINRFTNLFMHAKPTTYHV